MPEPDPKRTPDDTEAGYRDTLEEEAYAEDERDQPRETDGDPDDDG